MRHELARHLGVAMHRGNLTHRSGERFLDQLVPLVCDGRKVVTVVTTEFLKFLLPGAAFSRLYADFFANTREMTVFHQSVDQRAHAGAERALIDGQVIDQQIGKVIRRRAHADVGASFCRQA